MILVMTEKVKTVIGYYFLLPDFEFRWHSISYSRLKLFYIPDLIKSGTDLYVRLSSLHRLSNVKLLLGSICWHFLISSFDGKLHFWIK